MRVFPTYLFAFDGIEPDIDRRVISGGVSLSGDEDVIATDGGGRFTINLTNPYLDEVRVAQAWRAWSAYLEDGVVPVIVPIADLRHQFNKPIRVPTTLPFWEEADLPTQTGVSLSADTALRATTLQLAIEFIPAPLVGGMWLSIDHATMRHRAYLISEVVAQTATTATIKISPPLREATIADVAVELTDPRCVCRVDGGVKSASDFGFLTAPSVRFVEDFRDSYA